MFAGHYSSALAAKAASPRAPLWMLLLAAQFVDVLWGLAILAGVEHARLDASLPSNPLDLYDMPYTHSLVATAAWSLVAFAGARRVFGLASRDALLVALVVASHWFLDLVVHRPDLTIAGGDARLGFALWNLPATAFLLEILLVVVTTAMASSRAARDDGERRRYLLLGAALVALQVAVTFGPLPPSLAAMATSGLAIYFAFAWGGSRVDRAPA